MPNANRHDNHLTLCQKADHRAEQEQKQNRKNRTKSNHFDNKVVQDFSRYEKLGALKYHKKILI